MVLLRLVDDGLLLLDVGLVLVVNLERGLERLEADVALERRHEVGHDGRTAAALLLVAKRGRRQECLQVAVGRKLAAVGQARQEAVKLAASFLNVVLETCTSLRIPRAKPPQKTHSVVLVGRVRRLGKNRNQLVLVGLGDLALESDKLAVRARHAVHLAIGTALLFIARILKKNKDQSLFSVLHGTRT